MEFKFNSKDLITPPKIKICRQDLQPLGFLNATNIVIKPTFCNLTEISFTCHKGTNFYDSILKYMVLEVDGFGRFMIQEPGDTDNGAEDYKEVTAYSYEVALNKNTLTFKDDTVFKLWDAINPEKTLLGIIQSQTDWTIAHVDGSLLNRYRTMTIDNEEIYGLLAGTIADAFKCYFVFDTMNLKIYCYDREREIVNSGINLSFRNLVNEIKKKQASDDIVTALTVEGAEGVGINLVNPLGNNVLYNFDYYCNDYDWGIPKFVQTAIKKWTQKIEDNQEKYADLVLDRRNISDEQVKLDGELTVLKGELKGLQDVQAVDIAGGNEDGLKRVYEDIQKKEAEIRAKESEVAAKKNQYDNCIAKINAIVDNLSFKNNFNDAEYSILKYYINSAVYQNENFVFTNTMTESQKIDMAQQLYDQGVLTINKLAYPLYEFDCDINAFFFTKDYEEFTKAIELGVGVNLEIEDGKWVTPRLMQLVIDYDNPDNAKAILSDTYRLSSDVYIFSEDFNQSVKASRKTALSAPKWDEPSANGFYSTVNEYITSALNLANQEIINASDQEFTLGSYGLRGKKYIADNDSYDPHQLAMTNNVLAFTDDNWQSCRAALGRINIGGTEYYGLVGETVIGNLVAGNQLTISNSNNSFVVDGNGATLYNANFSIENTTNRILLSPSDGFRIQTKLSDGSWKDVLSEDTDGYIIAKGIKLEEASIGGWTVTKDGLSSPTGDYINSNGTGKLSLMTWNNNQATFDGNIYANNLFWRYGETDYASLFNMLGNGLMLDGSGLHDDTPLLFGGDFYVGKDGDNTHMYSRQEFVDTQINQVQCLHIESHGNIILGKRTDQGVYETLGAVLVNAEKGLRTNKLNVVENATFTNTVDISGLVTADEIKFNNILSNNPYEAVGAKCKIEFYKDIEIHDNPILVHGHDDRGIEITYQASTREVTIDGQTLKFVRGILVQ